MRRGTTRIVRGIGFLLNPRLVAVRIPARRIQTPRCTGATAVCQGGIRWAGFLFRNRCGSCLAASYRSLQHLPLRRPQGAHHRPAGPRQRQNPAHHRCKENRRPLSRRFIGGMWQRRPRREPTGQRIRPEGGPPTKRDTAIDVPRAAHPAGGLLS
jgi:hypothetical protein